METKYVDIINNLNLKWFLNHCWVHALDVRVFLDNNNKHDAGISSRIGKPNVFSSRGTCVERKGHLKEFCGLRESELKVIWGTWS